MESDLMPNDGSFFQPEPPEAQVTEKNELRAMMGGALALRDYISAAFDREIAETAQVHSIDLDMTDIELKARILALRYLEQSLREAKDHIEGLFEEHTR